MAKLDIVTLPMSPAEQDYLDVLTQEFPEELSIGRESQAVAWVEDRIRCNGLPKGLQELERCLGIGANVVHVTGLQLGELPPTPEVYLPPARADVQHFDIPQLAIASLTGTLYGNGHVRGGRIIADVFPKTVYKEKSDTAFGSKELFDFHVDGAVQKDTTPEVFSLHCLKNNERAATFVSTVDSGDFDADTYALLQEPVFAVYYEKKGMGHRLSPTPVLEIGATGKARINYYGAKKVECTLSGTQAKKYEEALAAFEERLIDNAEDITLQPGEMLFVDNRHTAHGRREFEVDQASIPERRWLRRVYIVTSNDLQQKVLETKDRVLVSDYMK